ncbi:MAG: hypothetical protein GY710_18895 [Desulfobacteraceae bacterium]|nr:hypothetical protein [Desulfobacteraceae bacterium]
MGNYPPNVTFYLKICLAGTSEELGIKLREKQWNRFRNSTVNLEGGEKVQDFFTCDTIDGKHIAVNLNKIQTVNILEEISMYIEDSTVYRGPIKILFQERNEYIEVPSTTEPEQLYDFFHCLDNGIDYAGQFVSFPDDDDEEIIINMNELLYIEAPQSLTDKGWELWAKNMGIED